ncbi:MAG TPA: hypothetical protein VJJ76_02240 [archaeon]|nr:hypothetical protein [archaeon]
MKIKIIKTLALIGILPILIIFGFLTLYLPQTSSEHVEIKNEKFLYLSSNGNVFCFGPERIYSMSDDELLQGSCCDEMVLHRYEEQIEGLKKYSHISAIPSDPYNISVNQAKELLNFDKNIVLTPLEQETYNEAMKMSDEGGPCCCMCWRWYVYEGLAKYLIREYKFNAQQVAEVWNLSDGCGGEGHATGVHA